MEVVRISEIERLTSDVKRFVVERPKGYSFTPGQATMVSINKEGWKDKKGPFTFTSIPEDDFLEFIIKEYPLSKFPNHKGLTEELHKLGVGDELLIEEPWGVVSYKSPGVFIAGGSGITPFISILRDLRKRGELLNNKLLFSNKSEIILERELREMLGERVVLTLSDSKRDGYDFGRIDLDFLKRHVSDFSVSFYVCGPPSFVEDISRVLRDAGSNLDIVSF